jgi:glyoxylase-like metal-dependent hydrolase (beta-lactamase superfamily II)
VATLDPRLLAPRERGVEIVRADDLGGLWSLRLPLAYPRTRSVNVFLLDRHTLLDCGSAVGLGLAGLEHALRMAGGRLEDIRTLVLSHLHADHASLAGELVERTGCELLRLEGPDTNIDFLREPTIDRAERARVARENGVPEEALAVMIDTPLADDGLQPRPPADAFLRAGDTVAGWEVVDATGHSPNQLALWDGARVLGADAAYAGMAPYLEWGHTPDPIAEYLATLDRLEALGARRFLPSHGAPDDDPPARYAAAREAVADMVRRVEAAGEGNAWELTSRVTGDTSDPEPRQTWISRVLCVKHKGTVPLC